MNRSRGEAIDPGQPSLIVQHGNTPRKWRPLKADLTVVGRARTCDIELASEQVAPVHCIIACIGDSWLIRDCGSPVGTYVNGQLVHEIILTHGDEIQLGTFSFTTHLPDSPSLPSPASAHVVQSPPVHASPRSRQRLAKLALKLRRRLHEAQARLAAQLTPSAPRAEPVQADPIAQPRICESESGARQVEVDRQFANEREAISEACACLTARVERAERDLALRVEETEVEIKKALDQVKQKCEEMLRDASVRPEPRASLETENEIPNPEAPSVEDDGPASPDSTPIPSEEIEKLNQRGKELDAFAAHLKRERLQIRERQKELAGERVRLTQLTQTLTQERENRRREEPSALRKPPALERQSNNATLSST
jgi:hypothetical protein